MSASLMMRISPLRPRCPMRVQRWRPYSVIR